MGDYRQASFSGAVFYVSRTQDAFGRRGAHHEFPYKDRGLWDDLGGKDGRRQIEAYVTDFLPGGFAAARDQLVKALQKGAGELVHPWLGRHKVVCVDYSLSHDAKELGVCRFNLSFIDADSTAGQASQNPVAGLLGGRLSSLSSLSGLFAGDFSVKGVMAFVSEASFSRLDGLLKYVNDGLAVYRSTEAALTPFIDAALNWFGDKKGPEFTLTGYAADKVDLLTKQRYLLSSEEIGRQVVGLISLLIPVSGDAATAYAALSGLWNLSTEGGPYNPPPRAASAVSVERINKNLSALDLLFLTAAAVEAAALIPWIDFDHQNQAAAVEGDIVNRFDALAARIEKSGGDHGDNLYRQLRTVKAHALEILALTAPSLARLGTKLMDDSWPSVRLCYDLYENLERESDLVSRNDVRHPGYMPAGISLEYLIDV